MNKPLPKWAVWKHIPKLKATEAIALTVNVEPSKVRKQASGKWIVDSTDTGMSVALPEFEERLFLFTRRFGPRVEMSLAELANWSQSVDWNIPIELAALAPWPSVVHDPAPDEAVNAAIASIVAPGADVAELRREIEINGWRFTLVHGSPTVHIPDGTVKGRLEPLANLYSLVCGLCYCSNNKRIAHLVRASGSSGGGAMQSSAVPMPRQVRPAEPVNAAKPTSGAAGGNGALQAQSVTAAPPSTITEQATSPAERRKRLDISRERGARRRIIENWDDIEKEYGAGADAHQVRRVLKRDADETVPALKTVQNLLSVLKAKGLIP